MSKVFYNQHTTFYGGKCPVFGHIPNIGVKELIKQDFFPLEFRRSHNMSLKTEGLTTENKWKMIGDNRTRLICSVCGALFKMEYWTLDRPQNRIEIKYH